MHFYRNRNESLILKSRTYTGISNLVKEAFFRQSFRSHNRTRAASRTTIFVVQYPPHYDGVTSEGSRSRDSLLDNVTDSRWRFKLRGSYDDDTGTMSSARCRRLS